MPRSVPYIGENLPLRHCSVITLYEAFPGHYALEDPISPTPITALILVVLQLLTSLSTSPARL